MPTRVLLSQYDVTGGKQDFAPPDNFGVEEWRRVMDKQILSEDEYTPGARSYDSVMFSEWNATVPRPSWAPGLNSIKNQLFSIIGSNGEGVYYPVLGVSYEQYALNNASVIPYSIKVDAINQKPSSCRQVMDSEIGYATRVLSTMYHNVHKHFLTFGVHVTDMENAPLGMTVELVDGRMEKTVKVVAKINVTETGGFYLDPRKAPEYARLRITTPNNVRAKVIGLIGVV